MPDITQPASGRGQNSRSPLLAMPCDLATRLIHSYPEKAGEGQEDTPRETTGEGLGGGRRVGLRATPDSPCHLFLSFPARYILFIWREDSQRYKNTHRRTSTLRSHPTHATHTHPSTPAQRHTHLEVNLGIQGLAPCQL